MRSLKLLFYRNLAIWQGGFSQICDWCGRGFYSKNEHELEERYVSHAVRDHSVSRADALYRVRVENV